jgi:very-short-patch-repair endonuclease
LWSLSAPIGAPIDHKAVWRLVRRQRGVITHDQLNGFGFSDKAIRHRLNRGRIFVVWPRVYRVGPMPLTREGWFMAAVLACGEDAVLSHDSAAILWGIRKPRRPHDPRPIHVSVPKDRRIRLEGIRPHRRNPMPPATTRQNIPLSQPLFTLVDLAATMEIDPLEAAINEADRLNLIDPESIATQLDQIAKFPGIGILRETLARYTRTDSNLERRFLALLRKHRLPLPATQEHIGPGRIDFHWPDLGLVVETDGLTYHRTPMQQLEDRRRDQAHLAAGRIQLRFANLQIREAPDEVVSLLAAVIRRTMRGTSPRQ